MTTTMYPGIGSITFTATLLPKTGDREDFLLKVVGPNPKSEFQVPISITRTALFIWGNPDAITTAENLGIAIFSTVGTASTPPHEGYWFDSYNSEESLKGTTDKIVNFGSEPFIKNWSGHNFYIKPLGYVVNKSIDNIDLLFSQKYGNSFFKSLEDYTEASQISDDLNKSVKDLAGYLYIVSLLSGLIDHIEVRNKDEDSHVCTECGQRHKQFTGSLQALRNWLTDKVDKDQAEKLTEPLQMIKNLRKQYPIHDSFETNNNIRQERKEIKVAKDYFKHQQDDPGHNAAILVEKFGKALDDIKDKLETLN